MPVPAPRDPGATRDILPGGSAIRRGCPGHGSRTCGHRSSPASPARSSWLTSSTATAPRRWPCASRRALPGLPGGQVRRAVPADAPPGRRHRHPGAADPLVRARRRAPGRAVLRDAAGRRAGCRTDVPPYHRTAGSPRSARPSGPPCGGPRWTSWPGCTGWTSTGAGLGFLDQPRWGRLGLDQRLGYYEHYMNWAYAGPKPTATRALDWLKAHRPAEPNAPVLLGETPGSAT